MRNISSKLAGQQSGFTLIELVIVIVIIGILAAVAIPQFSNVTDDANIGVANATASAVKSSVATRSALCKNPATSVTGCSTALTCQTAFDLLAESPTGTGPETAAGTLGTCKVKIGTNVSTVLY